MIRNLSWRELSQLSGWELMRQPWDAYANWYLDSVTWSCLNLCFLPHRMPGIHSDVDKFVSQFTLNGIKSSNICRP
jgi:hypothetical protein